MRIESSVTSVSWIPSEAISGLATRVPFDRGITHYDPPPPDELDSVEKLLAEDRCRFANHLSAFVEVEDGRIMGWGQNGEGYINTTTVRLANRGIVFRPTALPALRSEHDAGSDAVTFVQTAGGRTGLPAPRRVRRAPFVQFSAPLAWTTLALTIRADGSCEHALNGASPFPRHWIYDGSGHLVAKSGLIDFSSWWRKAFGRHSPWGDEDSEALTAVVESALERDLSHSLMRGSAKPEIRSVPAGTTVFEQGEPGDEVVLLLDGVVRVEVNGERLAEYGPGSIHGERAILEGGVRTSTVQAVTNCKLAVVRGDALDHDALAELSQSHRREER